MLFFFGLLCVDQTEEFLIAPALFVEKVIGMLSAFGEGYAPAVPQKKPDTQLLLQTGNLMADCLLAGEKLLCRLGKVEGFCK